MYKLVRYLKFIVLLNIYNQDAKASHLKLRKNVPLLITIFILFHSSNNIVSRAKHKCLTTQTILFRLPKSKVRTAKRLFYEKDTLFHGRLPLECSNG